jgi:ligand-binding sensor domain-containing protein
MLWRNPGTGAWTLGPNLSAVLGGLVAFTPDGPGFWVAGERGVAFARLSTPPLRPLREGDLPGNSKDLAVDGDYLWVATDGGLVRFRLDAIRP